METRTAYFAGGCFWCLDASFRTVPGVKRVVSGYSGGISANPSYEAVSSGKTGHAEVVKVSFDPKTVSYHDLLKLFFTIHDPSQLNRQGNDLGTQYRSMIFYTDEDQKRGAEQYILGLQKTGGYERIVTELVPLDVFYPAEEYHQDYFAKHPEAAYCQMVVRPKVEKALKMRQASSLGHSTRSSTLEAATTRSQNGKANQ